MLTDARLPANIEKFEAPLAHVAETSQNARKTFFALVGAALYSWLTIATTTDAELITDTASSPLPIINTEIPLAGFYLVAPLILLAVYFYFHLYLQRLWRGLSTLPARFPDGKALDEKAYPWVLNGLAGAHLNNLKGRRRPFSRVENCLSIVLAWWVIPFTLAAFWLRYLPRHDPWGTSLHVALIFVASWFGVRSYRLAVATLSGEADKREFDSLWQKLRHFIRLRLPVPDRWTLVVLIVTLWLSLNAAENPSRPDAQGSGAVARLMSAFGLTTSAEVSEDATRPDAEGGGTAARLMSAVGVRTSANLREAELSIPPSDWTGDLDRIKGADLRGKDLRRADLTGAFLVKARLEGADLRGADLSGADLRSANLSGADLRGAALAGAQLQGACGDHETRLPEGTKIELCPDARSADRAATPLWGGSS